MKGTAPDCCGTILELGGGNLAQWTRCKCHGDALASSGSQQKVELRRREIWFIPNKSVRSNKLSTEPSSSFLWQFKLIKGKCREDKWIMWIFNSFAYFLLPFVSVYLADFWCHSKEHYGKVYVLRLKSVRKDKGLIQMTQTRSFLIWMTNI